MDRRVDSGKRPVFFQMLPTDTLGVKDKTFLKQMKYRVDPEGPTWNQCC